MAGLHLLESEDPLRWEIIDRVSGERKERIGGLTCHSRARAGNSRGEAPMLLEGTPVVLLQPSRGKASRGCLSWGEVQRDPGRGGDACKAGGPHRWAAAPPQITCCKSPFLLTQPPLAAPLHLAFACLPHTPQTSPLTLETDSP